MTKYEDKYEIKKVVARFKSKNNVPLFAYEGIWHGHNGDEDIRYIETDNDKRRFITSFVSHKNNTYDKTLDERIDELQNTLILKYFESFNYDGSPFKKGDYVFRGHSDNNVNEIVSELIILMHDKAIIEFNEDWGVGYVRYANDKYVIELHEYGNMTTPLITKNINDIANWLIRFSNSKDKELFTYSKATEIALSKDIIDERNREKISKDNNLKIKDAFKSI